MSDRSTTGRSAILAKIRRATLSRQDSPEMTLARLEKPPRGIVPARGRLDLAGRSKLFVAMAEKALATVERLNGAEAVALAVANYLRARNLPMQIRFGEDADLASLNWEETMISVRRGPSDGNDLVGLSQAFGAIAESGSLALVSGPENPTTLNFLPEHHLVIIREDRIFGDYESIWDVLRERYGARRLPRTVNFITGPSRSGDIEQKLVLGAHGPRSLHILIVSTPS